MTAVEVMRKVVEMMMFVEASKDDDTDRIALA